jgi:hypothetical protein
MEWDMAFVVLNLASEYLPDGSCHIFSPNVPGFHVVEKKGGMSMEKLMHEKAMPILQDTLTRRVQESKMGKEVRFRGPALSITSFVPLELNNRLRQKGWQSLPQQVIAEIM